MLITLKNSYVDPCNIVPYLKVMGETHLIFKVKQRRSANYSLDFRLRCQVYQNEIVKRSLKYPILLGDI